MVCFGKGFPTMVCFGEGLRLSLLPCFPKLVVCFTEGGRNVIEKDYVWI